MYLYFSLKTIYKKNPQYGPFSFGEAWRQNFRKETMNKNNKARETLMRKQTVSFPGGSDQSKQPLD